MKANEAPEKLYIDLFKGEFNISRSPTSNSVEYTRTDTFIEKTADWLKENLLNHTYVYEGEVGIGMAVFLEDFRKYMKGE